MPDTPKKLHELEIRQKELENRKLEHENKRLTSTWRSLTETGVPWFTAIVLLVAGMVGVGEYYAGRESDKLNASRTQESLALQRSEVALNEKRHALEEQRLAAQTTNESRKAAKATADKLNTAQAQLLERDAQIKRMFTLLDKSPTDTLARSAARSFMESASVQVGLKTATDVLQSNLDAPKPVAVRVTWTRIAFLRVHTSDQKGRGRWADRKPHYEATVFINGKAWKAFNAPDMPIARSGADTFPGSHLDIPLAEIEPKATFRIVLKGSYPGETIHTNEVDLTALVQDVASGSRPSERTKSGELEVNNIAYYQHEFLLQPVFD